MSNGWKKLGGIHFVLHCLKLLSHKIWQMSVICWNWISKWKIYSLSRVNKFCRQVMVLKLCKLKKKKETFIQDSRQISPLTRHITFIWYHQQSTQNWPKYISLKNYTLLNFLSCSFHLLAIPTGSHEFCWSHPLKSTPVPAILHSSRPNISSRKQYSQFFVKVFKLFYHCEVVSSQNNTKIFRNHFHFTIGFFLKKMELCA